jgi:hypothetical protein
MNTEQIIQNLRARPGLSHAAADLLSLPKDAAKEERMAVFRALGPKVLSVLSGIPGIAAFSINDNDRGDWEILLRSGDRDLLGVIPVRALVVHS